MFKRVYLLFFLCFGFVWAKSQQLQLGADSLQYVAQYDSLDSVALGLVKISDTITPKILKPLDSATIAVIADSLSKGLGYPILNFDELNNNFRLSSIRKNVLQPGLELPKGELWVLLVIGFLLVIFAVLKRSFTKQLSAIIQAFFSNRALVNLNKEDNLFTSWPFLLLFIQFGFTMGMFFYLVAKSQEENFIANGFQSYIVISLIIIALYVFKILALRLLGFIFDVQKAVNEYVSILYLSYFNIALLFIPLVVAFALTPLVKGDFYITLALILASIIFVFQFVRAGINILSHYRFSKVYLFLYFCTLEICPILILIKAIGF